MSDAKHTPRPWALWRLSRESDPEGRLIITTDDGEDEICGVVYNEADAELIVRAVNCHDDLLAACKAIADCEFMVSRAAGEKVLAAIAKAEGR